MNEHRNVYTSSVGYIYIYTYLCIYTTVHTECLHTLRTCVQKYGTYIHKYICTYVRAYVSRVNILLHAGHVLELGHLFLSFFGRPAQYHLGLASFNRP